MKEIIMYELQKDKFNLLQGNRDMAKDSLIEVLSVIEGNSKGRIFVDDDLKAALVWIIGLEGFHIIGNHTSKQFITELREYYETKLKSDMQLDGLDSFEVGGDYGWIPVIPQIFNGYELVLEKHQILTLKNEHFLLPMDDFTLPEGYTIKKAEKNLFQIEDESYKPMLTYLSKLWTDEQKFFDKGNVYYICHENSIVSYAYTGYTHENIITVGIETCEQYRNKRFATYAATKLIQEYLHKNYTIQWDCDADNFPSQKVAKKLGFQIKFEYDYYCFDM